MRILFWNTHRNVDINSYILDIVNQNEIDVLVLAEYMAEINELNDNLKQCKKSPTPSKIKGYSDFFIL